MNEDTPKLLIEFESYDRFGEKYIYNRYVYKFYTEFNHEFNHLDVEEELNRMLTQQYYVDAEGKLNKC